MEREREREREREKGETEWPIVHCNQRRFCLAHQPSRSRCLIEKQNRAKHAGPFHLHPIHSFPHPNSAQWSEFPPMDFENSQSQAAIPDSWNGFEIHFALTDILMRLNRFVRAICAQDGPAGIPGADCVIATNKLEMRWRLSFRPNKFRIRIIWTGVEGYLCWKWAFDFKIIPNVCWLTF